MAIVPIVVNACSGRADRPAAVSRRAGGDITAVVAPSAATTLSIALLLALSAQRLRRRNCDSDA